MIESRQHVRAVFVSSGGVTQEQLKLRGDVRRLWRLEASLQTMMFTLKISFQDKQPEFILQQRCESGDEGGGGRGGKTECVCVCVSGWVRAAVMGRIMARPGGRGGGGRVKTTWAWGRRRAVQARWKLLGLHSTRGRGAPLIPMLRPNSLRLNSQLCGSWSEWRSSWGRRARRWRLLK